MRVGEIGDFGSDDKIGTLEANADEEPRRDGPAMRDRLKIFIAEMKRERAKRSFPKNAAPCFLKGRDTGVTGDDFDGGPIKPAGFFESHSDGKGLIPGGA